MISSPARSSEPMRGGDTKHSLASSSSLFTPISPIVAMVASERFPKLIAFDLECVLFVQFVPISANKMTQLYPLGPLDRYPRYRYFASHFSEQMLELTLLKDH